MPDKEQNTQSDFMIEKIKARPLNQKKLIRRTILTAAMAVIFGLIACVTFLVLEPIISNWLYPEEEPEAVIFPEDQEEMSPEEMLAEPAASTDPSESASLEGEQIQEQLQEILSDVSLGLENYTQLYAALQDIINNPYLSEDGEEYRASLRQHMVTVRGVTSNIDWFENIQESSNQTSGLIVADNGRELLILVDYTPLEDAENLVLDLNDGADLVDAYRKGLDKETNLAVVAVSKDNLSPQWMEWDGLAVASLGSSNSSFLTGTPVIAMGSPMGVGGSVAYGILTSDGLSATGPDRRYKLLTTDISGSRNGEGVLFNLQGQVIGIITDSEAEGMENLIRAYGITEMKRIIEKLSNGESFAYLGITGTDVTAYAHRDLKVPYGAYVTELEMDSPAMLAGIQAGDVVTAVNDTTIQSFEGYCAQLMQMTPGASAELTVSRQVQEEYKEMRFTIELGERPVN